MLFHLNYKFHRMILDSSYCKFTLPKIKTIFYRFEKIYIYYHFIIRFLM